MARKKNKTKRPAAPPEKPPAAPPALTTSVQDEPSINQSKPTTTTITTSEVPNEIKNVDKSRKDLNQKQDAPKPQKDDDPIFFESLSGPQEKLANERTNAKLRKNTDSADKIFSVRKYWNTLSIEKRRSFLEVSFHDLRAHYASEKDRLVVDMLTEALSDAENNKTWKVWVCCHCSRKFKDCESHKQHVSEKHIGKIEPKLQQLLPEEPDSDSVDMILSGCWKPVDLCAAMKIIENQAEHQSLTTVDSSHSHSISQTWPLVDHDPERAKHLENIQCMFQLFLKHKCLSADNVKTAIHDAICDLEELEPGLENLDHGLDKTLACVCFLGAEQLLDLFLYLQNLSKLCQSGKDSEKTTSAEKTQGADALVSDYLEGIALSDDSNHLILKKFLLTEGTVSNRDENADLSEEGGPHGNSFLSWIYGSSSTDVELVSWTRMREERSRQGREIVQKLKEELYRLRNLCGEKFRQQCCVEAFSELSDLCDEELEKSEQSVEYVVQSWRSVLNKRLEGIAERNEDPVLHSVERDTISAVLEKTRVNSNKEDLRMLDNKHEVEKIAKGFEDERLFSYLNISNFDVRIMQKLAEMQQLEHELEAMSAFDYREIMFLPVKKFLQGRLEDLAALNDAIEKSNAVAEELLAAEAESNANKGADHSKQIKGKSKKKKKKKKKAKRRAQGVGLDKEILSDQETEEQVTLAVETDVDQRESEFVATTESVDDLKQLEEDLEADERKLMERLEYQSQIENEAKQKRLAEKSVGSGLPKDSVGLHSGSVEKIAVPGPSNQGISKDGLSPNPTSDGHSQTLPEKEKHEASSCPSNQGISEDGLSPSGRQAHIQNPIGDGHSQSLSEKENHEASPSQTDDEKFQADLTKAVQESLGPSNQGILEDCLSLSGRQAHTLSEKENEANLSHQWVHPHLGDDATKELGQLSAEEHDVERFQADHTKAALESLGPSNQGISEDGLSPSGRQAHSQNPTSDGHSQTLSEKENHEDSPPQIDEERFQADLRKAVQLSLEPWKIMDPAHKIIAIRKYWNVLSIEKKLSLLLVSHHDLQAHYASEEDGLAADVLLEALSFIESNETWKFWACCLCGEKFADCESHKQHVWVHIGDLLLKLQPVLPKEADSGWADMLLNGCWKPVDLHASMKILENRMRHESLTTAESSDVVSDTNGSNKECSCEFFSTIAQLLNNICLLSKRKRDFSSDDRGSKDMSEVQVVDEESKAGVVSGGDLTESGNSSGISSSDLRGDGNEHWVEAYPIPQSWPLVDDPKRAQLLDGIHGMFQLFLKHKCLADTHLKKVIHYTMDELQGLAPGLHLLDHGLYQTPACIRFLDATQLQNVLDLLQELSNSCQLHKDSEKATSADDSQGVDTLAIDVFGGVNLSGDSSHLVSNEFLLTVGTNKAENASMGEKVSVLSEDGGLGGDAFLSWLFASSSADVEAVSWIRLREDKGRRGMEILQELEKEFNRLQKLCQEKCEHLCYMDALCTLLDLCYEEFKKRHQSVEYVAQSFESLLRKQQEELLESQDNPVFMNSRFKENAISLVLKGKEALNVTQCGQPGLTSHLCDLESSNKDDLRMLDNLHQYDKSILLGIRTHGNKFSLELCRLDARIRQNLAAMKQLERELGAMSSFDYREILFFLIRPLWRVHLQDLADKDAKEKSDAARRALLPELTLDGKNYINKGGDNSKHFTFGGSSRQRCQREI